MNKMDVYGPADYWDPLPDGTTVGTTPEFVAFAVGYAMSEKYLQPDEAERLAELLVEAAKKCREHRLTLDKP